MHALDTHQSKYENECVNKPLGGPLEILVKVSLSPWANNSYLLHTHHLQTPIIEEDCTRVQSEKISWKWTPIIHKSRLKDGVLKHKSNRVFILEIKYKMFK